MRREEREFLAELARINGEIPALALRIMEGSASAAEQQHYGERLIAAGGQLTSRAEAMNRTVIEGMILAEESIILPEHTVNPAELDWKP